ncbi:MAG: glutamate-1-semialdehyde-2,1-aminomutase [Flavobacteriales bacterium]|nr:glutamate-1-semialdehyde-2,1-aminomutase [Flavobacteriales bacterium]
MYKRSSELFQLAKQKIPGGVNSPVRAFKSVGGTPIFIKNAKGSYLFDEDKNKFIDYISSWGPMIIGHSNDSVVNAIADTAKKGTSFGIPTSLETEIAKLVVSSVPNIDKIRFVNSGTEACMSAVRLARGYTNREKIIKFSGCYHGHSDSFLIQAGSGAATLNRTSSPGVTKGTAKDTLVSNYNNIESVLSYFRKYPNQIAAVIIEPVAGNMGCIPPKKGFLEAIRKVCNEYNSLLIFDEVMTGFRLSLGGAQELLNVKSDIVTFGKVIGGGLPVGAFGSRDEIMSQLAPEGPIYQAGTLSGNPLAMIAGLTTLKILKDNPNIYKSLKDKTATLHKEMKNCLEKKGIDYRINRIGSMISLHFTNHEVIDFKSAAMANNEIFKKYFHGMLDRGVYLPPSQFESYFLNDALSYDDIEFTINAFEKVLRSL